MCTPKHVERCVLKCASQMTVQRCFTDTILANHATKSVCEWLDLRIVFWGAELAWPSNHFRRRTVLHTCRGNVNNTRACFDWQATQTLLFALSRITFLDLSCVRCVIQNTEVLRSCVRCVFQNAHLQLNFKIRKLPSCENGLSLYYIHVFGLFWHPWSVRTLD